MTYRTLVSVDQLAARLDDPAWHLFDCRHDLTQPHAGAQAYQLAHLPGAHFLHLDRDLSGAKTGRNGRHPLPDVTALGATFARHGIGRHDQVVAYDNTGGMFAARLWWLLRWLGHDTVAVLDGGLSAWVQAGRALTSTVPIPAPCDPPPHRPGNDVVDAAYVQRHLHDADVLLIDARAAERFMGRNETLDPVAGHIPGAVNRFFNDNLTADGYFKPAALLRTEFDGLLAARDAATVVHYCGSGVTSCHNALAMEIAGLGGSRLYAGSWSEWCSDAARPMATPATTASS